ncbi:MAG: GtrA family protein [Bryobacteraceae bacterium]
MRADCLSHRIGRPRLVHLIRFGLVGVFGAILQLMLLHVFRNRLGVAIAIASPLAVEITVLHNFVWHQCYTWNDRLAAGLHERATRLWRFHIANGLISITGNTILLYTFVQRLQLPLIPSAVAAIAACSVANFLLADRWIYAAKVSPQRSFEPSE